MRGLFVTPATKILSSSYWSPNIFNAINGSVTIHDPRTKNGVSTPQYDLNWIMYSYIEMSYVTDIGSKKSCYPTQQVGDHTQYQNKHYPYYHLALFSKTDLEIELQVLL